MTPGTDIGAVVSEVATRLRSGATAEAAWKATLARNARRQGGKGVLRGRLRAVGSGKSVSADAAAECSFDEAGVPSELRDFARIARFRRVPRDVSSAVPAAIAVCRLSHASGAPAADVLEACASGITESAEASAARHAALAGPRASAWLLAWLPLLGILLGAVMGVDPLGFLLRTGIGRALAVCAAAAEVIGVIWVRVLVARAAAR